MRLFVNPRAGAAGRLERLESIAASLDVATERAESPSRLRAGIRREIEGGAERVLVAGGDGTLHQAVQLLAGTSCALAPIALGSGNDLCRSLGLPLDPSEGIRRALTGRKQRIDLGACGNRYFAGIAGCGLDGAVLDFLDSRSRRFRGPWVYPYAVIRSLAAFRPIGLTIECDGTELRREVMLAAWANTGIFGGGMRMAPMARVDDGLLDLVLVEAMSKVRLMALFPKVYSGSHLGRQGVSHLRGRRFRVAADGPLRLHADGELLATSEGLPLEVGVAERCLDVIL